MIAGEQDRPEEMAGVARCLEAATTEIEIVDAVSESLLGIVRADGGCVALREGEHLRVWTCGDVRPVVADAHLTVPLTEPSLLATAVLEGRVAVAGSPEEYIRTYPNQAPFVREGGHHSYVAAPLLASASTAQVSRPIVTPTGLEVTAPQPLPPWLALGVLGAIGGSGRRLDDRSLDHLRWLAAMTAQALIRVRRARLRGRAWDLARRILSAGSPGTAARIAVTEGIKVVGAVDVDLGMLAEDRLVLVETTGLPWDHRRHVASLPLTAPLPATLALRHHRPLLIAGEDWALFPDAAAPRAALGVESLLALPLIAHRPIGVLALAFAGEGPSPLIVDTAIDLAGLIADTLERTVGTEREQHAAALLATLVDRAPVGWGFIDLTLTFRQVNDRLAEMNGLPAAEHVGRGVAEVVPDLAPTAERLMHRLTTDGEPVIDVEIRGETPARPGMERVWHESWYPVHESDGEFIGAGVIVTEVTDRVVRAERDREYRRLLRALAVAQTEAEIRDLLVAGLTALGCSAVTLRPSRDAPVPAPGMAAIRLDLPLGEEAEGLGAVVVDLPAAVIDPDDLTSRVGAVVTLAATAMQRCRLQARVVADHRQLVDVLAATRTATWSWNPVTDAVDCSAELSDMFGLAHPGELATMARLQSRLLPDDAARLRISLQRTVEDREGFELEVQAVRDDGTTWWLWTRCEPLAGVDGPRMVQGVVRDVSTRRLAEEQARSGALRLRRLIDGLSFFVGLLSVDGVLLEANQYALTAAGLQAADVVARDVWDTPWWSWSPQAQDRLRDAVRRAGEGETVRYEERIMVRDDRLITIDFQLVPLIADGRISALIPSGIDITERKDSQRRAAALAVLTRQLAAASRSDEVIEIVTRLVPAVVQADSCALFVDQAGEAPAMSSSSSSSVSALDRLRRQVMTTRVPLLAQDEAVLGADEPAIQEWRRRGLSSLAIVPLLSAEDRRLGVLELRWTAPTAFTERRRTDLATLADISAQAIQRAMHHDAQTQLLTALQRELLPSLPPTPGLDLSATYVPASNQLVFGGDWYDVLSLSPTRTAVIVGDVVGHGVQAAARMAGIRTILSTLVRLGQAPDEVLRHAHSQLLPLDEAFLGTAIVMVIDAQRGLLTYARAGHPAPLLADPQGRVTVLDDGLAPALGLPPIEVPVGEVALRAGSVLLAFTDGLNERPGMDPDQCQQNAIEALGLAVRSSTQSADVLSDVMARLAPPQLRRDDIAAVVARTDVEPT